MSSVPAIHFDRIIADVASLTSILYVSIVGRTFRRDMKVRKEQEQHLDDVIKGVAEAPGVEARPSLVQRLAAVEEGYKKLDKKTDDQNVVLEKILGQLQDGSALMGKIDVLSTAFMTHLEGHARDIPKSSGTQPRRRPRPQS